MCVAAALPAVLGIASAGMQFMGQTQAANAQNDAVNRNVQATRGAYNRELVDNQRNFIAKSTKAQQDRWDATLEARDKQGQAIAMAADTGTSGNSIDAVRNSILAKASENDFRISSAFAQNRRELTNQNDTAHARAVDRINSMPYAAKPSVLGLAINAASAVFA